MRRDNITKFPLKTERKTIIINGKKYDTLYIELKSMLPDVDLDYFGYYDFDLEEHGALSGFLFVEKVIDYTTGASYRNVLFDSALGVGILSVRLPICPSAGVSSCNDTTVPSLFR